MITGLNHTGFVVRDIDKSIAFYTDVMGLDLLRRRTATGEFISRVVGFEGAHLELAILNVGGTHNLELVQYVFPPGKKGTISRNDLGASHLAFNVDDMDEYYDTMSKKGLRFVGPPGVREMEGTGGLVKSAYAQDPDDNWLEFVEMPR